MKRQLETFLLRAQNLFDKERKLIIYFLVLNLLVHYSNY